MKFHLNTVFYKIFFINIGTKKDFFIKLCDWLFTFSDINESKAVKGLSLEGFHYFKNIYRSQIKEINEHEISKIDRITPIVDIDFFPFIYSQDCLEIRNDNIDINKLINVNIMIDKYLKNWFKSNNPKKYNQRVEMHLTRPGKELVKKYTTS